MKKHRSFRLTAVFTAVAASLVVLTILVGNILIYSYMEKTVYNNSIEKYEQIFNQANVQLETSLQDIMRMSAALSTDSELVGSVNLMQHSTSPSEQVNNEKQIRYLLNNAAAYHPHIDNVGIYLRNKQVMMNELQTTGYHQAIPREPWFSRMLGGAIDQVLISGYKVEKTYLPASSEQHYRTCCLYAIPFNSTNTSSTPAILLVSINQEYIESFLAQTDYSDGRIIALFDENNQLIYTSDPSQTSLLQSDAFMVDQLPTDTTIQLEKQDYFFVRRTNTQSSWNMVALIPKQALFRDVVELQQLLVKGGLLSGLLGVILCFIVGHTITAPFNTLMESMNRAGGGDLNRTHQNSYIREINLLFTQYDTMLRQIDRLILQIKTVEKEKRTAELMALQSQINPHFTYNTLSSIQWVAQMQNANKTAEMISLFSGLLRLTTSQTDEYISVESEFQQIEYYIEIMKLRYNGEITVEYQLPPEIRQKRTLKLILQPIVENSFMHGFCNMERDGTIHIKAYAKNNCLYFHIQDDGVGIAKLAQGALPQTPKDNASSLHKGIGITNVHNRIQTWFGKEYGLKYISQPDKGTLVIVTQPLANL